MTNQNDSFIDEVTEDLRRDRMFALLRRWGWLFALIILTVIGWSIWREYSATQAEKHAETFGDAVLAAEAAHPDDPAARATALAAVDAQGAKGREALAAMLAANAAIAAGDTAKAVSLFDKAATATDDKTLADLARLRSVIAQGPGMDAAKRDGELADLAKPGAPYEMLALEQQAVALADAGRTEDAIALIRQIQQKDNQSDALRRRLSEMLIALGAAPETDADVAGATTATVSTAPASAPPASAQ